MAAQLSRWEFIHDGLLDPEFFGPEYALVFPQLVYLCLCLCLCA
jgi:hypothetical protein